MKSVHCGSARQRASPRLQIESHKANRFRALCKPTLALQSHATSAGGPSSFGNSCRHSYAAFGLPLLQQSGTCCTSAKRPAVAAAAGQRSQPDPLLLRLLSGSSSRSRSSSSSFSSEDALLSEQESASPLRQGIINPNHGLYRAWWGLLIGAAAFTGIFVPWELGFGDVAHMYSLSHVATWIDLGLVALFMADIVVSHFVAYEADEMLVDEPGAIAANYRRQRLALDIISAVPFDWIAYGIAAATLATAAATSGHDPGEAAAVAAATTTAAAATLSAPGAAVVATLPAGAAAVASAAGAAAPTAADAGLLSSATALIGTAAGAAVGAAGAAPLEALATAAAAAGGGAWEALTSSSADGLVSAIACLKGLHLVRLYRVRWFFRYLEYDLTVSLLTVTVARNLVIVLYLTHWVACGFNFLARSGGYAPDLLVGLNPDLFSSVSLPEQYIYSLYWSVTTLAGNEWNGMDAVTDMRQVVANTFRASVFLLFNIALGAYILGTITLLVVKSDERTGRYRDMSSNLKTYSTMNQLPPELKDEMQEHLRLKFNHQEASDDQVLSIYPSTIRRRILRHLYLRHLRGSYLFRGAPRKYLDSLLAASRLELFRPGVDLLAAGDAVNELFIVVSGQVELRSPLDPAVSQYDWDGDVCDDSAGDSLDPLSSMMGELDPDMQASAAHRGGFGVYLGPRRVLGPGELFGEISFFTEIPQMETVRSLTTVRVMVISRSGFESIERNFPIASRLVLENLKRRSEAQVAVEFPGLSSSKEDLQHLLASCPSSLMYSWASPELVELMMDAAAGPTHTSSSSRQSTSSADLDAFLNGTKSIAPTDAPSSSSSGGPKPVAGSSGSSLISGGIVSSSSRGLTARQELVLSNLVRVMAVISQHVAKQEEDRTTDFLYAATRGDTVKLRAMLQQGFNPDSSDYDGRTALMLACVRGHRDVVELLLAAGANPRLDDNLGRSALLEACYHGHDAIIDTLKTAGASLSPTGGSCSGSRMSTSGSSRSNISGVSSSSSSRGPQQADPAAAGSFGSLSGPVGYGPAAAAGDVSARSSSSSLSEWEQTVTLTGSSWSLQLASLLCNCVYECNLPLLRRLLRAGAPVDIGDYDKRTALHISAAEGNAVMVRVLVEEGGANVLVQDRWGNTPMDEAQRVGAALVVNYLQQAMIRQQEVDLARRAQQQRLLAAQAPDSPVASNWRRVQEQQQQLRSQGASELYRLRQLQAQQVRRELMAPAPSEEEAAEAAAPLSTPTPPPQQQQQQADASSSSLQAKVLSDGPGAVAAAQPGAITDAVGQLMKLADLAQQALTLKVEEIEVEYVRGVQHHSQEQQQDADGSSISNTSSSDRNVAVWSNSPAAFAAKDAPPGRSFAPASNSNSSRAAPAAGAKAHAVRGNSSSGAGAAGNAASQSKGGNNVVSAVKLQQPQHMPASYTVKNGAPAGGKKA